MFNVVNMKMQVTFSSEHHDSVAHGKVCHLEYAQHHALGISEIDRQMQR